MDHVLVSQRYLGTTMRNHQNNYSITQRPHGLHSFSIIVIPIFPLHTHVNKYFRVWHVVVFT